MRTLPTLMAAAAMAALLPAAMAQPPGRGEGAARLRERLLERFDANADGRLDDQERKTARAVLRERGEELRERLAELRDGRRARLREALRRRFAEAQGRRLEPGEREEAQEARKHRMEELRRRAEAFRGRDARGWHRGRPDLELRERIREWFDERPEGLRRGAPPPRRPPLPPEGGREGPRVRRRV
jgi:hypothetical protein